MNEHQRMRREIQTITIILMLMVCGLSILIFHGRVADIGIGIVIGALAGLIGFNMINQMAEQIELVRDAKAKGYQNYVLRYVVYLFIFGISVYKNVSILALFAGMLCHKASILLYVFLHRKED